jgi:hypothetical protein
LIKSCTNDIKTVDNSFLSKNKINTSTVQWDCF